MRLIPALPAALVFLLCFTGGAMAEAVRYVLDPARSEVRFTYQLLGVPAAGTMPITRADLDLDLQRIGRSRAVVELNAAGVSVPVPFVAEALRGPSVLDTARHPTIRFVSSGVTGTLSGAMLSGTVTLRGVTRPLTLTGRVLRPRGSASVDFSRLTVELSGRVNRNEFGASGFPNEVADTVELNIRAAIQRAEN